MLIGEACPNLCKSVLVHRLQGDLVGMVRFRFRLETLPNERENKIQGSYLPSY